MPRIQTLRRPFFSRTVVIVAVDTPCSVSMVLASSVMVLPQMLAIPLLAVAAAFWPRPPPVSSRAAPPAAALGLAPSPTGRARACPRRCDRALSGLLVGPVLLLAGNVVGMLLAELARIASNSAEVGAHRRDRPGGVAGAKRRLDRPVVLQRARRPRSG